MNAEDKIKLTYFKFIWLTIINLYFNLKIRYKKDIDKYHRTEYWTKANNEGDCEDHAIAKMVYLIKHNKNNEFNSRNLCLAECITENEKTGKVGYGGYHIVLVLFTNKGNFVMDNRNMFLAVFEKLRYVFIKITYNGSWRYINNISDDIPKRYRFNKYIITKILFNFYHLLKSFILGIPNIKHNNILKITKKAPPPKGYTGLRIRYEMDVKDFNEEYDFFNFIENAK